MGKYVYVYYAGNPDEAGDNEAWGQWFGALGSKLVDGGNPFAGDAQAVSKAGVMAVDKMPATGYSIVEASSMADAVEMSKGCPLVQLDKGAVCIYEALPM